MIILQARWGSDRQTVYPITPFWLRRKQWIQGLLAVLSLSVWGLEWPWIVSEIPTPPAVSVLPLPAWWQYRPLDITNNHCILCTRRPAPTTVAVSRAPTQPKSADTPATPVQDKVFAIHVMPASGHEQALQQRWQIALAYQQQQAWAEAQQAFEDVLRMDADFLPAWQGLLAVAQAQQQSSLVAYCQAQLAQRWPDDQTAWQE